MATSGNKHEIKEESRYQLSVSGLYDRTDEDKIDSCDISKADEHDNLLKVQRWYPEIWERYRPVQVLGIRAQKTVVKATDNKNEQSVVIKIFDISAVENWGAIERFEGEILSLKSIEIEGVPKIIDYVKMRRYHYLAEEYIDGAKSLQDYIDMETPLSEDKFIQIFKSCLKRLTAFHAQTPPMILRDMKPSNLLERNGEVWFINIGMDRLASTHTHADGCDYSAPEQDRGEIVSASNLYTLGMIMMHIATWNAPSELPNDGYRVLCERILPPELSPRLLDIFERILVLEPEQRLISAEEAFHILEDEEKKSDHPVRREGGTTKSRKAPYEVVANIADGIIFFGGMIAIPVILAYLVLEVYIGISGKRIHLSEATFLILAKVGISYVLILVMAVILGSLANMAKRIAEKQK